MLPPVETPVVVALNATTDEQPEMPVYYDPKTFFLGGIFLLLFLTAIHTASDIVVPVVLAFMIKLVLQPVMRQLAKLHIPQFIASALVIIALLSGIIGLGTMLSGPATAWAEKLPASYPQLQERLTFLSKPVEQTQKLLTQAEDITKGAGPKVMPVAVEGTRLSDKIIAATQTLLGGLFTTTVVLFFLLASGDTFLRRLVEVLPRFKDKRQAVDISQKIEHDISMYLLTITTMNAAVGIATVIIMRLFHIENTLLWGTLAFLLNYVPIVGPIIATGVYLLVGLLIIPNVSTACLPAACYYVAHLLESSVITPTLLAKRFTLNPVLVILSLIFWYWMWGVAGAILAMPMLAITKIICDRIQKLSAFGHFLGGA